MSRLAERLLGWLLDAWSVDRRAFSALIQAFVLMDLRGQHFARAVGMKPHEALSPMFWVIGQCFAISAGTSLLLFTKTDVFFFALANLAVSLIALSAAVLVEFNEVVLDPRDLGILGHRPVSVRTYVAARLANLVIYVSLMYVALNLFPLLLGAALRESGPWYAPAYLVASLSGSLIVVCVVVLAVSYLQQGPRLERAKELLAWTQIVLFGIVGYGGQLMLRDKTHAFLMWGAFPPGWVHWTPAGWLAHFVASAALEPRAALWLPAALMCGLTVLAMAITFARICQLYRRMQPVAVGQVERPVRPQQVGSVTSRPVRWITRSVEERIGCWLCLTLLRREQELCMRSLLPLNVPLVVVLLGLLTGQFANPMAERELNLVMLPVVALFSIALTVPSILYNLSFCRDHEAVWVLLAAPLANPAGVSRGACKAIQAVIVTPLAILFAVVCAVAWGDPVSAVLHAALGWLLAWPLGLAAMWLVVSSPPFSRPHVRGGSLGPVAIPMLFFSGVFVVLAGLHLALAFSVYYWIAVLLACWVAALIIAPRAAARQARLFRSGM